MLCADGPELGLVLAAGLVAFRGESVEGGEVALVPGGDPWWKCSGSKGVRVVLMAQGVCMRVRVCVREIECGLSCMGVGALGLVCGGTRHVDNKLAQR